ncbi:iron(III) transport system ATP-binding protein [Desulfuromusa kysingii]|uniref:Iron(III) transport system ATP-binding protein n=1 Tax=Desulfuromusa kysingii TaxID=37625 RepID=A0A1H4DKX3_9BACT|nr:ATP-binding cassette domain-containing protein [Desulfuromusa kysingii]SEA72862.1 iron(III) transport system ATP-binding protein [Desulfuromusa kysingii]
MIGNTRATDPFLEVRNISKSFGQFVALNDISLAVKKGEFVSILGPSGCGKTTLLRVIAGLEVQNQGTVWLAGQDVSREPVARRNLGIVFQSYALFPNISIVGNVMYGLRNQRSSARRARAMEMLELVDLADQAYKFPAQLSGGQQQRVALARALAPEPSLLLLDEPLSALDAQVRSHLRIEIRRIQKQLGITTVMVTHDQEEALTMADRVVVINAGKLMQFATPREMYCRPNNTFVADFVGSMNFLNGCKGKDSDSVFFDQYSLHTSPGAASPFQGYPVTAAIRPKDIRIVAHGQDAPNVLRTCIENIEFRGASDRLYLRVLHQEGGHTERRLEIDVQTEAFEDFNLRTNMELRVQLPAEKMRLFPPAASVS